jgi:hypothetical protein
MPALKRPGFTPPLVNVVGCLVKEEVLVANSSVAKAGFLAEVTVACMFKHYGSGGNIVFVTDGRVVSFLIVG